MRGDIGQIQVGKAPEGTRSVPMPVSAVQAPVVPKPKPATRIAVPAETGKRRGRTLLITGISLLAVVIFVIILAATFGGKEAEPTPTPTPSATVSLTPAPTVMTLADYFGAPKSTASTTSINEKFELLDPAAQQAIALSVVRTDQRPAPPNEILIALFADVPLDVEEAIIGDAGAAGILLSYGQTELFDAVGQPRTATGETRPILVLEIDDASLVNQRMQTWEGAGFAQAATGPFDVDVSKALVPTFTQGTRGGIPVRYQNFSYADRSIDWAIVLASNGKNYLVVSGSRQSLFFAIDHLLD